jgi:sigma54-dependent transcription regulator
VLEAFEVSESIPGNIELDIEVGGDGQSTGPAVRFNSKEKREALRWNGSGEGRSVNELHNRGSTMTTPAELRKDQDPVVLMIPELQTNRTRNNLRR